VAWQKQLRDRYLAEGTPPVPHLDLKRAQVRRVGRHLAEQIILKYEWLGTMAQSQTHYGIFFGSYCAGVCCVAAGHATGGVNTHRPFGLKANEVAILVRGACVHWAPKGTNSKLVSWTCRLVPVDTGARLLIAYSDTDAGEIGTIYQACNWTYIGRGDATMQFVAPNGRVYDQKIVYDTRRNNGTLKTVSWTRQRDAMVAAGWQGQMSNPKHRYVCILDKSDATLVTRVERMRQPYPKRPRSVDSDAPAIHAGEDGATPILGLHDAAPTAHAEAAD
jgi:hypothetical protein